MDSQPDIKQIYQKWHK